MRRKSTVILLILVMIMVTGANLFGKAARTATIKWIEWWDPEYGTKLMDELVARFEKQSGIHVDRTAVPWGNMYDNLVTNAQAGTATYDLLGMEACCFLTGIDKL